MSPHAAKMEDWRMLFTSLQARCYQHCMAVLALPTAPQPIVYSEGRQL